MANIFENRKTFKLLMNFDKSKYETQFGYEGGGEGGARYNTCVIITYKNGEVQKFSGKDIAYGRARLPFDKAKTIQGVTFLPEVSEDILNAPRCLSKLSSKSKNKIIFDAAGSIALVMNYDSSTERMRFGYEGGTGNARSNSSVIVTYKDGGVEKFDGADISWGRIDFPFDKAKTIASIDFIPGEIEDIKDILDLPEQHPEPPDL